MREPKQVVLSKDGLTISVGEKEFKIDNLQTAEIALIMKERCKGFLKEKRAIGEKAKSYALAGDKSVLIGLGCWFFSKFFQKVDVIENFLRGAGLGLSTAGLFMSGKSMHYNKKKKGLIMDYQDDQGYLGMEIIRRQCQGEDTKMAEQILDEIIEEEKNDEKNSI